MAVEFHPIRSRLGHEMPDILHSTRVTAARHMLKIVWHMLINGEMYYSKNDEIIQS